MLRSGWIAPGAIGTALAAMVIGLCGCRDGGAEGGGDGRKLVVCTTTMIADLARQIGGDDVQVVGIMKSGTDPHIYDPTPDDSIWFRKADVVFINGLHLEGRMVDMIEAVGGKAVHLAEQSEIKLRKSAAAGAPDPHVWWNVRYFAQFARKAGQELQRIDPARAQAYAARTQAYVERLERLDEIVRASVATIPETSRVMITSHDAFYYYGEAYGLQVDAVLGISTDAQASAGEPRRLAQLCAERKVPAIFHETSVSAAQNHLVDEIMRLALDKYSHRIRVAGPLFSDSLGEPGSGADTYIGAVEANTRMIVEALGGHVVASQPSTGSAP